MTHWFRQMFIEFSIIKNRSTATYEVHMLLAAYHPQFIVFISEIHCHYLLGVHVMIALIREYSRIWKNINRSIKMVRTVLWKQKSHHLLFHYQLKFTLTISLWMFSFISMLLYNWCISTYTVATKIIRPPELKIIFQSLSLRWRKVQSSDFFCLVVHDL